MPRWWCINLHIQRGISSDSTWIWNIKYTCNSSFFQIKLRSIFSKNEMEFLIFLGIQITLFDYINKCLFGSMYIQKVHDILFCICKNNSYILNQIAMTSPYWPFTLWLGLEKTRYSVISLHKNNVLIYFWFLQLTIFCNIWHIH